MAKIGTAHLEIKPVVNDEALAKITAAITAAVRAGVEEGMKAAPTQLGPVTVTFNGDASTYVPHDHTEYVEGCFRCDLSRDERKP